MTGTSIQAQVLTEVKELRCDIHALDTKLQVHLSQDTEHLKTMEKINKVVFGNGNKGLDDRVSVLETTLAEKKANEVVDKKFKLDIKSGAIVGGITLVMSILAQLLMAKLI